MITTSHDFRHGQSELRPAIHQPRCSRTYCHLGLEIHELENLTLYGDMSMDSYGAGEMK